MNAPSDWWNDFFSGLVVDFWRTALPEEVTVAETDFLDRHLKVSAGGRLLDVPCGHGRLAIELAARGYRVTGVDLSAELLEAARADAAARGIAVTWRESDMRDLSFPEPFDAAFCAGSSFGYFDDSGNADFLRAVAGALRPGGRFVLDASKLAETIFPAFRARHSLDRGGLLFEAENRYDALTGRYENRYTLTRGQEVETKVASHRIYTLSQVVAMLKSAGLSVVSVHGSADGRPFDLGSPGCFVVSERRAGSAEGGR